jgi:hypothetical protein
MGYGGGYLIKPVQSKNGSISELFLAGQAQVTAIRDKVREERRVQSEALGKATDFTATGIQDMDSFWAKAGSDARAELLNLQEQNRNGELTRSQVVAQSAKITGEMTQISQLPTIIKEQRDLIIKEEASEGYSGLTLAEFDRTWFKDINAGAYAKPIFIPAADEIPAVPEVVATQADIDAGKMDADGNPAVAGSIMKKGVAAVPARGAERRKLTSNYEPVLIEGKQHMKFTYEQMDPGGSGAIQIKSIIKPLSSHVNPSKIKYFKVDDKKEVATFKKNIGDTGITISGPNGTMMPLFQAQQVTANGTTIMGRIAKPEDVDKIAIAIEQEITSKGDDWYASYAFDVLGARDPFGDGATGIPMTPKEVEQRFPGSIYFDYDAATKTGKPMKFTSDPLLLDVDSQGNTVLTDDTKRLVESHYRNQLMASLNVETEVYKDRAYKESGSYKDKTNSVSGSNYSSKGNTLRTQSINLSSRMRFAQMQHNYIIQAGVKEDKRTISQSDIDQATADMTANGQLTNASVAMNTLLPPVLEAISGPEYDQTTQGAVNIGGSQSKLSEVLNVSTFNNSEFTNITGFYTAENKEGQPIVILTGDALYGKVSSEREDGNNDKNSIKMSGGGQFTGEGMSNPITDGQTQNLYEHFFDQQNGNPEMIEVLKKLGFYKKYQLVDDLLGNQTKEPINYKAALHAAQDYINTNSTK